jgi:hypothetical protein
VLPSKRGGGFWAGAHVPSLPLMPHGRETHMMRAPEQELPQKLRYALNNEPHPLVGEQHRSGLVAVARGAVDR